MLSGQLCVALRWKHERGFGCSTRSSIRRDDACWQRGAIVFLPDCVTLESSDLSALFYLHSEQSKTESKAHGRHFHVWLISYRWSDWQSPDRAAPEALQSTDQPFTSSFMDDAFLARSTLTLLSLFSSLLISCLMLFLPLFHLPLFPLSSAHLFFYCHIIFRVRSKLDLKEIAAFFPLRDALIGIKHS